MIKANGGDQGGNVANRCSDSAGKTWSGGVYLTTWKACSSSWMRSLMEGKANFTLNLCGRIEFNIPSINKIPFNTVECTSQTCVKVNPLGFLSGISVVQQKLNEWLWKCVCLDRCLDRKLENNPGNTPRHDCCTNLWLVFSPLQGSFWRVTPSRFFRRSTTG